MMQKLIIFFAVVSIGFCAKLSEELDGERAEQCGIASKPDKPSSNLADDEAPWSFGIAYNNLFMSAILISPRHVLSYGLLLINAEKDNNSKKWKWGDGSNVDFEQCSDNEMPIPKKILKEVKIHISMCQDPDRCGLNIVRSVVDGYYLGNCASADIPFGMVLLEISSNVPQDEPFFTPVCVPAELKPAVIGENVKFHSFKADKNKYNGSINIVTSGSSKVESCSGIGRFVQSICGKRPTCGDRRGAIVKKIDERDTVIGILYSYEQDCKNDHYVSVGFFKDKLCALAGICKTTFPSSNSFTKSTTVIFFLMILKFLFTSG